MDILDDTGVSKLSAKVFFIYFFFKKWTTPLGKCWYMFFHRSKCLNASSLTIHSNLNLDLRQLSILNWTEHMPRKRWVYGSMPHQTTIYITYPSISAEELFLKIHLVNMIRIQRSLALVCRQLVHCQILTICTESFILFHYYWDIWTLSFSPSLT